MSVNWLLGAQQGPTVGEQFQLGADQARQRQMQQQQFEQQQQRQTHTDERALIEEHRDDLIMGAQLLQNVHDDAGWQQVRQRAIQINPDLAELLPEQYDQAFRDEVVRIGSSFQQSAHPQQPTNIEREVQYYRSIGRDDLAQQLAQRHAQGPPSVASNGDGTFTILPQSVIQGAGGAPTDAAPTEYENPQTGEVIRLNPQTNQWEPVQGGPSPQGSGGF